MAGPVLPANAGKTGRARAITAAAHKLARILFHMLTTGQAYDEIIFAQQEAQHSQPMQQRSSGFASELNSTAFNSLKSPTR